MFDLHRASVLHLVVRNFQGVRPVFLRRIQPPHLPHPFIISPSHPASSVKCVSHSGKLAKHYEFTLKESIPAAGRVRECLQTSVIPTTFFSSVSFSSSYPFFF